MRKDNKGAEFEHSNRDLIGTTTTGVRGFYGTENLFIMTGEKEN